MFLLTANNDQTSCVVMQCHMGEVKNRKNKAKAVVQFVNFNI